jgi:hypothetical protein
MRSSLLALLLVPALARADAGPPALPQRPAVSATQGAFAYAGDLWIVGRDGGDARRLTAGVGLESSPVFSPDGRQIAFAGEYEGNLDVYVIPAGGGVPQRIPHHPDPDIPVGWTPDGQSILFRSSRASYSRFTRLFTVPAGGGQPAELPLPMAEEGSLSPDGRRVTYVPFSNRFTISDGYTAIKKYRGGTASPVWIADLADSSIEKLPRTDSSDFNPMWVGERVYFLSDREAAIIDERFNEGGCAADYVVDYLRRPVRNYMTTREGADQPFPQAAIPGPKLMLINEQAGSGGDYLPYTFRQARLGPLVGKRTWGGLVAIGGYQPLLDGGGVTAPRWATWFPDGKGNGRWEVENRGVAPDVEVEFDPRLVRQGKDPQLEKAVEKSWRS